MRVPSAFEQNPQAGGRGNVEAGEQRTTTGQAYMRRGALLEQMEGQVDLVDTQNKGKQESTGKKV